MNDDELDLLVASTSPISDGHVAELPLAGPEAELMEAIMSTPRSLDLDVAVTAARPQPQRLRWRRSLAPAAAVVALLVGVVGFQQLDREGGTAWATPLLAVAKAAPRYLVEQAGWTVTRADEFTAARGEMTFGDSRRELELRWQPVDQHDAILQDRAREADHTESVEVAGRDAELFRYQGTSDFTTLWSQGEHSVEARGTFAAIKEYTDVLAALREVDIDTWLRAMPASVVRPDGRAVVVDEMLADIPLPDGFDAAPLRLAGGVKDRYQLGAMVAGSAACAWIESWIAATDAGDTRASERAVEAMATSHRWSVLIGMQDQGAYPGVVWELADAMATNAPVSGGKPMTIRESYANSLGCAAR